MSAPSDVSPAKAPRASGIRGAKSLADESVELVRTWLARAQALHRRPNRSSARLAQLLADPDGPPFALGFVDRVLRPEDLGVAARALRELGTKPPRFLGGILRLLLILGAWCAPLFPGIVVPLARRALRSLIGHLIINASPASLDKSIKTLRRRGDQLNINLLGEAVLGHQEAAQRAAGIERLIARTDVDYVSVKVSSVVAQLSMWGYDHTVSRVVDTLAPLYEQAAKTTPPTFINLDMEEYRDLGMTVEVFQKILSRESLRDYYGGIVLQTYLPDALGALKRLESFAQKRVVQGGAPIKVRLVKGANLQMEQVDAALHDWPLAVLPSKQETDTNYKRVMEWAMTPERTRAVRLGIAGHNLFDLAFGYLLATKRGVIDAVDCEMLVGMAPDQADAVRETFGRLVLYTPVVSPEEFDSAVGYLVRRLDENASSENFMSAVSELHRSDELFAREENRFRASLAAITAKEPALRRNQNRQLAGTDPVGAEGFHNEPDTDPSLPANQDWIRQVHSLIASAEAGKLGLTTLRAAELPDTLGPIDGRIAIDALVAEGRRAARDWAALGAEGRGAVLRRAARELSARRGELLAVMAQEAGKTLQEGDPEVSEAIDFARYYSSQAPLLDSLEDTHFEPVRLTLVTPPWNFPVAIPTGSVTAALAAGSSVIIKPAPQVRRCAAVMVEALWAAGVPRDVLRLVDVSEGDLAKALISHPGVDRIVLTGAFDTARLFRSWRADLPILAETSGKNAIVITPSADLDLAVAELVKSAFGHAGQKCSAASLAILVGSVARSAKFRRQLLDAASSLKVGLPDNPASVVGPVIEPPGSKLRAGLTELAPGEEWLLEPQQLDSSGRLWSPGIRVGVRPGSDFHRTEYFGPVLGIMEARSLSEAISMQNAVDYGLTAGIFSLSPDEVNFWLDRVEAGNLYVNRGITGAIVRRQPFGGWKRSSVGPTAKAGGPNYLLCFGNTSPAAQTSTAPSLAGSPEFGSSLLDTIRDTLTASETSFLAKAIGSDNEMWRDQFGVSVDISELGVERNLFRYRPTEVTVRAASLAPLASVLRVLLAAARAGAAVKLSCADPLPEAAVEALTRGVEGWRLANYHVERELDFVDRVIDSPPERIRLVNGNASVVSVHFNGNPAIAIWADPVVTSGRVEMLPFLREQAISLTAHRFGAADPRFTSLEV